MKKHFLFLASMVLGLWLTGNAQTVTPSNNAVMTGFETNIVQGAITMVKTFVPGDGKEFVPVYTLIRTREAALEGRKPIQVSLSRQSFDSVFTKVSGQLSDKWNVLNKYIQDNGISLSEEKGWVAVLRRYNSFF